MEKRTLGQTGLSVSVLGLGAAPAAFLGTEADRFSRVLNLLLDAGVNLLDTAAGYPGSEQALGKLVGHRRNDYYLVSKCGNKVEGLTGSPWSAELIGQSIDRSLANLGVTHLDVMLLHSCDLATLQKGEAVAALADAKRAGKVRHIGYSGDNEAAAYAASQPEVEVIETSINLVDQINIDKVLPPARQNDIGIIAKRPIANAAWKDLSQQPGMYANYAKTYTERFAAMKLDAKQLGFDSWPELALRFTLSQNGVTTAIIGTTNPDNARANLAYVAKGPLDPKVVTQIRDAFRKADPQGQWTGQT
jgi:aryl-alcohol dehydrogenase-like predicted oxidoreductase